jgi:ATP-dependent RNA helicase DHX33
MNLTSLLDEMRGRADRGYWYRELANPDSRRTGKVNGESSKAVDDHGDEGKSGLNLLLRYDIIVIDEAHERTLNTDFLCGALKRVQRIRKRLVEKQLQGEERVSANGGRNGVVNGDDPGKGKSKENGQWKKVKELMIVVMSDTLDPGKFQRFFQTWAGYVSNMVAANLGT